jgi:hypothetical protein
MSIVKSPRSSEPGVVQTRRLAGALGAIVVVDALWVRAPFLVMMAVPFIVAACFIRRAGRVSALALASWCAVYVAIGVSFALSNGLHAPLESGSTASREVISAGDFAFVYIGTPLAAWLAVHLVRSSLATRRASSQVVSA